MKTFKKFKIALANDIDKEEKWLTEMSAKGAHFYKYSLFFYHFEEDQSRSYIYQTDFQSADEEEVEHCNQAGWEQVDTVMEPFHYFRAPADVIGAKRSYSGPVCIKGVYRRMLTFYAIIYLCMIVAQAGLLLNWEPGFF